MAIRKQHDNNQHNNNRHNKKVFWILGGIVVLFFLLWIVLAPNSGLLHYMQIRQEIAALSEENKQLEDRNAALAQDIKRLHSDDTYLEEVARKKYGLLKKDETVFEFKPSEGKKSR